MTPTLAAIDWPRLQQHLNSKRQTEIVELLCQGLSQPEIAAALFIAPFTVRNHLALTYQTMQVNTAMQLVMRVMAEFRQDPAPAPNPNLIQVLHELADGWDQRADAYTHDIKLTLKRCARNLRETLQIYEKETE